MAIFNIKSQLFSGFLTSDEQIILGNKEGGIFLFNLLDYKWKVSFRCKGTPYSYLQLENNRVLIGESNGNLEIVDT